MPFNRPTLKGLVDQLQTDIATRLPGVDSRLRRSVVAVLARVLGGQTHLLYGFQAWIARQILADSAEAEMLERHGGLWGVTRKAASYARGEASWPAQASAVIPSGTAVKRSDGADYIVEEDAAESGGQCVAKVRAVRPDAEGNADVGVSMALVQPVGGVTAAGSVSTEITGGADVESDADLRARIVARIQQPPHGGAAHDWRAWALGVPGVTRAWPRPLWMGLGTVGVLIVADEQEGTIIPSTEILAACQAHLEAEDRRPVTADVYVVAPAAVPLDVEISGLSPASVAVQAQVEAELADLLLREAEPGGTILVSHIREAISIALGEHDHALVSPTANVTHAAHEIAVMGAVTWS